MLSKKGLSKDSCSYYSSLLVDLSSAWPHEWNLSLSFSLNLFTGSPRLLYTPQYRDYYCNPCNTGIYKIQFGAIDYQGTFSGPSCPDNQGPPV